MKSKRQRTESKRARHGDRFRPQLEALENRSQPSCFVMASGPTVLVLGDDADNSIVITDDDDNGAFVIACDEDVYAFGDIRRIVVKTRGGDDRLTYRLASSLATPRKLQVELGTGDDFAQFDCSTGLLAPVRTYVRGASGDDVVLAKFGPEPGIGGSRIVEGFQFHARLGAGDDVLDVFHAGNLLGLGLVQGQGGEGNDSLNFYATDPDATTAGTLRVDLRVESGDDFIGLDYAVAALDSHCRVLLRINGGAGEDMMVMDLDVFAFPNNSAELVAVVDAGSGDDDLNLNHSMTGAAPSALSLLIDGGAGFDFGFTNNPGKVIEKNTEA